MRDRMYLTMKLGTKTFVSILDRKPREVISRNMLSMISAARVRVDVSHASAAVFTSSRRSKSASTSSTSTSRSRMPRAISSRVSAPRTSRSSRTASRRRSRPSLTSSCRSSARSGSASAGGPSRPMCARIATSSSGRVYIILLDDLNVAPLRTGDRAQARARVHRTPLRTTRSRRGRGDQRPQGCRAGVHQRPRAPVEGCRQLRRTAPAIGRGTAHRRLLSSRSRCPASTRVRIRARIHRTKPSSRICSRGCSRSIPRISNAASARSACSRPFAASRSFSKASVDAARRCCGSPKASTIRWPRRSARRAATRSSSPRETPSPPPRRRTSTCSRSIRAG